MAKSLRSQRRRKMRSAKRDKNAPRELNKLKKVVGNLKETIQQQELYQITPGIDLLKKRTILEKQKEENKIAEDNIEKMEIVKPRNKKTLQNEDGHFPVWMHKRKVKQIKAKKNGKKFGKQKKIAW